MQTQAIIPTRALVEVVQKDLEKESSSLSPSYVADAVKTLSRFVGRGIELVIPTEFAGEIVSGQLIRDGGVIRDASGKIKGFLKDPSKAKQLLKGTALAFALVDIAQTVLLNEKLKEIQKQLQAVNDKLDALVRSTLDSAFVEAAQIPLYSKPSDRNQRIHSALDKISDALPAIEELMKKTASQVQKNASCANPHDWSLPFLKSPAKQAALTAAKSLLDQMRIKTSLLALRAKLQEELNSPAAANHTRMELTTAILYWSEFFETTLGAGSVIRPILAEPSGIEIFLETANHFPTLIWLLKRPIWMRNEDAKTTAEDCEKFLEEIRRSVATCILDHVIIQIM